MDSDFGYCTSVRTPERKSSSEQFVVEDLLNFSNDDGVVQDDTVDIFEEGNNGIHNSNSNSDDSSSDVVTPPDSVNSFSGNNNDQSVFPVATGDIVSSGFSEELCVPYDDLAELEWLSNFVEESFSSEDMQKSHLSALSSAIKTRPELTGSSETRYYNTDTSRPDTDISPSPVFSPEMPVPGKARSKRSRAAPCNWTSRLKVLSKVSPDLDRPVQVRTGDELLAKPVKLSSKKKSGSGLIPRMGTGSGSRSSDTPDGEVRRCLHCSTDKTPQWRTGPLGPKTLCNACGVRYKSGRLVPEYRPASSPSFVMTKHSNSHRKVMELRRQKELQKQHQYIQHQHYQQQLVIHSNNNHPNNMIFDPTNTDDYLIHQHIGPDYRQLT